MILKTTGATPSVLDRYEILGKIEQIKKQFPGQKLPPVYLLHGDLTDDQMNALYNHPKVKAMTMFTHGEGFGRPILEFSTTGKPMLVSNWSGHIDFLKKDAVTLMKGRLTEVPKDAKSKKDFTEEKWNGNNILLFGSEGYGLNKHTEKYTDFLVKIEINTNVESLNISNSAAIVFHYINQQKKIT